MIYQVALIRKVDAFGLGDKEDKGWRFNAGLRCIRDAHGPVLKARQRVFPDGSFHQVVEGRGSHPFCVLFVNFIDEFKNLRRALSGQRGNEKNRGKIHELDFVRDVLNKLSDGFIVLFNLQLQQPLLLETDNSRLQTCGRTTQRNLKSPEFKNHRMNSLISLIVINSPI